MKQSVANATFASSPTQITKSASNIYILKASETGSISLNLKDTLYIYVNSDAERETVMSQFPSLSHQIAILSPYNNKGCFYPPSIADLSLDKTVKYPYFLIIKLSASNAKPSP